MGRQHHPQEARLEDGRARSQSQPLALAHHGPDVVGAVGVDEVDGHGPPICKRRAEVDRAGIERAAADESRFGQREVMVPARLDRVTHAHGRIEDGVGPHLEDAGVGLGVERGGVLGRPHGIVGVGVNHGGAGLEAGEGVAGDLFGEPGDGGVLLGGRDAVDGGLDHDGSIHGFCSLAVSRILPVHSEG